MSAPGPNRPNVPTDLVTATVLRTGPPLLAAAVLTSAVAWTAAAVTVVASGNGWPRVPPQAGPWLLAELLGGHHPAAAWAGAGGGRLGPDPLFWVVLATVGAGAGAAVGYCWRRVNKGGRARPFGQPAAWGTRAVETTMAVRSDPACRTGQLTAGTGLLTGRLLAAADCISAVAFGPNGSGKSTGLIAPNVLEWSGPLVMTTTKPQDVTMIHARRTELGPVWVLAPGGCPGLPTACWSPVGYASDEDSADRIAEWLCEASGVGDDPRSRPWMVQARKLIKPLLLAANVSGGGIDSFVDWVYDGQRAAETVRSVLRSAGFERAVREYDSTWSIHSEGIGSVLFTAFGLADAYSRKAIRDSAVRSDINVDQIVHGGPPATLVIVAPESEMARFAPLVTALLSAVVHAAEQQAARIGGPLSPRLLLALDEAGNVFRFPRLPHLLTTARGNGIQLLLIYHDIAQLEQLAGRHNARTVLSNAKLRMLLPGVGDLDTLRYFSDMLGRAEVLRRSTTVAHRGELSTSTGPHTQELAPVHSLLQLPHGQAVVQYQNLPPLRVKLRFSYRDADLVRLAAGRAG